MFQRSSCKLKKVQKFLERNFEFLLLVFFSYPTDFTLSPEIGDEKLSSFHFDFIIQCFYSF